MLISENNMMKKLAPGLGDPSDGLHDPPLERINWNAEAGLHVLACY